MTKQHRQGSVHMIPTDLIVVLNPRDRNHRVFGEIVNNMPQETDNGDTSPLCGW